MICRREFLRLGGLAVASCVGGGEMAQSIYLGDPMPAITRRVLAIGDSLSVDPYTHPPSVSWPLILREALRRYGVDVDSVGVGGATFDAAAWNVANMDAYWVTYNPTDVVVWLGVNDCRTGYSVAKQSQDAGARYDDIDARGSLAWACTQAPNYDLQDDGDPVLRDDWNAWIRTTPPGSVEGVIDLAAVIDPDNTNTYPVAWQSDDVIHPNTYVQTMVAAKIAYALGGWVIDVRQAVTARRWDAVATSAATFAQTVTVT